RDLNPVAFVDVHNDSVGRDERSNEVITGVEHAKGARAGFAVLAVGAVGAICTVGAVRAVRAILAVSAIGAVDAISAVRSRFPGLARFSLVTFGSRGAGISRIPLVALVACRSDV